MGQVYVDENSLSSIGNALRNITNTTNNFYPNQMGPTIENISTGLEITDTRYLFKDGARTYNLDEFNSIVNSIKNNATIKNTSEMFFNCDLHTENGIVPNFDTSAVYDMNYMFSNISNHNYNYIIPNFNTSNVIYMAGIFSSSTLFLDFSQVDNWDISKVNTMNNAFAMYSWKDPNPNIQVKLPNWNFSGVRYFENFLRGVRSRNYCDFNSIDISGASSVNFMFSGCNAFSNISNITDSSISNYLGADEMFSNCVTDEIKDIDLHRANGCRNLFRNSIVNRISNINLCNIKSTYNMSQAFLTNSNSNLSILNIDLSNIDSSYQIFYGISALKDISDINLVNVTNSTSMFAYCHNLINVENLYIEKTLSCYSMFNDCTNLISISNFNTYMTTNMVNMFFNCNNLTNVPNFDTSNVTNMVNMFSNCYSLTEVPNFDTGKVINMSRMFYCCFNLIDVPQFNTSETNDMLRTFISCNNLSNESIQNIINMCLNSNVTNSVQMNLSNSNSYSPLADTKFNNSYYQDRWQELTDAGWKY